MDISPINNLPSELLVVICSRFLLGTTTIVCKHWYKILLLDRMNVIRADIPSMTTSKLTKLPTIFYNDFTLDQQLYLPNVLFCEMLIENEMLEYSRYKYKISWRDIIYDSEYVAGLIRVSGSIINDVRRFPVNKLVYFRHLFKSSIQYRYYIITITHITQKQISDCLRGLLNCTTKIRELTALATFIWNYGKQNIPGWNELIEAEYKYMKDKVSAFIFYKKYN